MKVFKNWNPKDLDEALELLHGGEQEVPTTVVAAGGGSDLLGMIKDGITAPEAVVNLKSVAGLDRIESDSSGIRIGAMVTLQTLASHPLLHNSHAVLAQAAASVGTPQIQNVATIGGNVCQRPWCWYYRQGFPCFKNGGDVCYSMIGENQLHAIFGGGPSFIVHPSDTAPALCALDAKFQIAGVRGERTVPCHDFFLLPEQDVERENILEKDEILTEVILPPPSQSGKSRYIKIMDREAWTHAVVSLAVSLEMTDGAVSRIRAVLGGVAPIPWRLSEVQNLLQGRKVTEKLAAEAGRMAVAGAVPMSKNGYKIRLVEALVRRTLLEMAA